MAEISKTDQSASISNDFHMFEKLIKKSYRICFIKFIWARSFGKKCYFKLFEKQINLSVFWNLLHDGLAFVTI